MPLLCPLMQLKDNEAIMQDNKLKDSHTLVPLLFSIISGMQIAAMKTDYQVYW